MEDATVYKLLLHEEDEGEREVIKILEEYGRGRSLLISVALQDMIRRYHLTGKKKDQLKKFAENFEFIRDFTADLEERYGEGYLLTPRAVPSEPQKSDEEREKEEDKKAFDDLMSAFGPNTF